MQTLSLTIRKKFDKKLTLNVYSITGSLSASEANLYTSSTDIINYDTIRGTIEQIPNIHDKERQGFSIYNIFLIFIVSDIKFQFTHYALSTSKNLCGLYFPGRVGTDLTRPAFRVKNSDPATRKNPIPDKYFIFNLIFFIVSYHFPNVLSPRKQAKCIGC